jgi:hypothetical protein
LTGALTPYFKTHTNQTKGNGLYWGYESSTGFFNGFDANGYWQQQGLTFYPEIYNVAGAPIDYGDTPIQLSQTVAGLKVGSRYRLQFFMGAEGGRNAKPSNMFPGTGVAAIDVRTCMGVLAFC